MADSVEECIYTTLTADSTFMASFEGVFLQEAEDGTDYPFITFWLVDDTGAERHLNGIQGEARIQFDLWDDDKIRSARLRKVLADKVRDIDTTVSPYYLRVSGITEATVQRASKSEPYHGVVDGIVTWWRET